MATETKNVVAASELSDEQIHAVWKELYRDCMDAIQAGDMKAQFISAARAVLAAATPAASVQAMWQALEKLAQSWDGVAWDEGDDVGATIRHDFTMYAKEFGAAPAVQQPAEGAARIAELEARLASLRHASGTLAAAVRYVAQWGHLTEIERSPLTRALEAWDGAPAAPTQAEGQCHD